MKRFAIIMAVLLAVAFAFGQTGGFSASPLFFSSHPGPLSACPAPAAGTDSLCDITGMGWAQSLDGAAYTAFGKGPAGPQGPAGAVGATGPAGATGATGPQGIPGIPQAGQSFSETCSNANISTGASGQLKASGCMPTVP